MRIDAHHHFWNYSVADYGWIGEGMDVLKRDFGPADLRPLIEAEGISGVVSVQARQSLEENDFLLRHAGESAGFVKGVVGWVPLVEDSVGEALARYADRPLFKGVRHVLQSEPDDGYMLRDDFNRGLARLHDFGLVYDILIFHRHLPQSIQLVDRHPRQVFVLDHVAKPEIRGPQPDTAWAARMKELGRRENVFCKVSGLVTEVSPGLPWDAALLRPYLDTVLEVFGPRRLMFGSDWPVCLLRSPYAQWVQTVRDYIATLTPAEQAAILGETATDVYGLGG